MRLLIGSILCRLFFVAACAAPLEARAQVFSDLEIGDPIRVTWTDGWATAYTMHPRTARLELVSLNGEQLIGRSGDNVYVIPLRQVRGIQRRIGTKPPSAPEIVIGSAIGFVAGMAAGTLKGTADPTVQGTGAALNHGMAAGVLVGAPAGALIAYLNSKSRPIYEDIGLDRVRPVIGPTSQGGVGFGLTLSTR